jgi:type IV pilus assembly protein PilW
MQIHKLKGVTLVELMIGMTLGVVVTSASLQAFLTIKQIYMAQQALARIQENARICSILIGEALEASGNLGCSAFKDDMSFSVSSDVDPNEFGLHPNERVIGISQATFKKNAQLPVLALQRIKSDSDILWIKSINKAYPLGVATSTFDHFIVIQGQPKLKDKQIISISDCSHVDFVRVRKSEYASDSTHVFISSELSKHYREGANIGIVLSKLFYVGETGRRNGNGFSINALYSTDVNGRTLELIEGVDYFQVLYGQLFDNGMKFLSHDKVTDWQNVSKVQVSILFNSIEDGLTKPKSYQINKQDIMPNDRLMRMWWHYEWSIKSLQA